MFGFLKLTREMKGTVTFKCFLVLVYENFGSLGSLKLFKNSSSKNVHLKIYFQF